MKMNSEYDESTNLLEISPWANNTSKNNAIAHNAIGLGYVMLEEGCGMK